MPIPYKSSQDLDLTSFLKKYIFMPSLTQQQQINQLNSYIKNRESRYLAPHHKCIYTNESKSTMIRNTG